MARHPEYELVRRFPQQFLLWYPPGTDLTGYVCAGGARLLPEGKDELVDVDAAVDISITAGVYAGDGDTRGPGWVLTPDPAAVLDRLPGERLLADVIITNGNGVSIPTPSWIWVIRESASTEA